MKNRLKVLAFLLAMLASPPLASPLRAEPLDNENGLPPAEILVLATRHLSDIKGRYDLSILGPLLDRLEKFNPDLIAIEALRGVDIAAMELQPARHNEALFPYAYQQRALGGIAQAKLALTWSGAQQIVDAGIVIDQKENSRSDAILHYLAAYEFHSALLTWYGGSAEFREAFSDDNSHIAEEFEKRLASTNEYYSIALPLAGKLGHPRLYPVDDHFESGAMEEAVKSVPGGWDSLMAIYGDIENHPFLAAQNSRFEQAAEAGDVLPYYRWLNLPETAVQDEAFQWEPLMREDPNSRIGSLRLAGWEMRNLRMAAHLSELMIAHPGKRILYIVGSGHKPILDRYFKSMTWVRLVSAEEVLGAEQ